MHKLLKRQLSKYFGSNIPDTPEMQNFIASIDENYKTQERYFSNLEHALAVNNEENTVELNNFRNAINKTALVVITGKRGLIISANEKFYEVTGYQKNSLEGCDIQQFLNKQNGIDLEEIAKTLKTTNYWKGEIKIKGNYDQPIWLHCTIVPLIDVHGKISRYMSTMIDITSRKIYEEEIVRSEDKYKKVINNIKEVIFQLDDKFEITFLNNAWKDILGYEIYESLGLSICDFVHADDKDKSKSCLDVLLLGKEEEIKSTVKFESKIKGIVWIDVYAKAIKGENGILLGASGTLTDVTEKTINENLLLKSYAFQKAILDSAKQSIISTDLEGNISTFNSGAEDMISMRSVDVIGKKLVSKFFIFNNDQINKKEADFKAWIKNIGVINNMSNSIELECLLKNQTGKTLDIQLSITTIADQNDHISGYLFIASDISVRKKAENENFKLNNILEESPDFVHYYDLQGNQLYANKAFKAIRYLNNQEINLPLNPPWAEIIIKKKAIPYAKANGSWKGETAIIDNTGKEVPVLQLIIVHKDDNGNPVFISSVMRDITQRKEYEQRIIQSEKRNRDLVNYSQAIICTHDLEGVILTINPAGCELTGYQMDEMIGHNISEFMPEFLRLKFMSDYIPQFKNGKHSEGILTLQHKEGDYIYLLYKNYKVEELNGESYIIGFAQDITERLKAENELKSSKQQAEDSSRTKEMFLANMSHEIRTPMNGIVGLTNLLLKTQLNDKQKQFATSVKQSAENLLVIINDILDFSKIHAGKLEITKRDFDLNNLVYNLHQTFQVEAVKKHIQLKTSIDDDVFTKLIGDDIRLNQILVNLLSNAIKFTDKGIVSLKIKSIVDQEEACRIRFEIKDSGIGISEDKIEKIFQSFTQANADTSRKYGGTGLGLSIVKNLLNLLGSNIEVSSIENEGSTFSFELNLEKCLNFELNNVQKPEENLNSRLNGIRILLAEDNKVNQLFAHELITDWGASLDIADNGKIALEMLQKFKYDLILMDIQMPEMSGLDATIHIREQMEEPIKSIPIIAMTANAMKGDDQKFLNAGMNDVIFKPYEAHELFSKIEPIIKTKKIIIPESKTKGNESIHSEESIDDLPALKVVNLSTLKAFSRGKQEFIIKMIGILDEAIPGMINLLERAIQQEDLSMIRHHSHKLIPNMNMLGNAELETTMKWIEDNALEAGLISEINERFKKIDPLLKIVIDEVSVLNQYYQSKKQVTL